MLTGADSELNEEKWRTAGSFLFCGCCMGYGFGYAIQQPFNVMVLIDISICDETRNLHTPDEDSLKKRVVRGHDGPLLVFHGIVFQSCNQSNPRTEKKTVLHPPYFKLSSLSPTQPFITHQFSINPKCTCVLQRTIA